MSGATLPAGQRPSDGAAEALRGVADGPELQSLGVEMCGVIRELYPICRSITGDGLRRSLRILQRIASVASEGLGNVEESISVYRELLSKNPRNEQAFAQLETGEVARSVIMMS